MNEPSLRAAGGERTRHATTGFYQSRGCWEIDVSSGNAWRLIAPASAPRRPVRRASELPNPGDGDTVTFAALPPIAKPERMPGMPWTCGPGRIDAFVVEALLHLFDQLRGEPIAVLHPLQN